MRIASMPVAAGIAMCFFCSDITDVGGQHVPPPGAITLRTPSVVYATGFRASWTKPASVNFAYYHLYCDDKPDPGGKSKIVWKTAYINDTALVLSNLNPGTRWYAKVRAYNGFTWSESNEITVVTPACSCGTFTGQRKGNMVLIPAGCYIDGAGHEATVSRDFFMDTTEVTETEWFLVQKPDSVVNSTRPKAEVCWYRIILFCNRKSGMESRDTCYSYSRLVVTDTVIDSLEGLRCDLTKNGYRLPTEDEWEYAYRGGTATDYYWGKNSALKTSPGSIPYPVNTSDSNEIDLYEWWDHNAVGKKPHETGLKRPNAWYLHDMGGNISEFVWDVYGFRPRSRRLDYAGPPPSSAPNNPFNDRVVRGGMFSSQPEDLSAGARSSFSTTGFVGYIGFRTVCTVP